MAVLFSSLAEASLKAVIVPLVANEVRGLVMVGPVFYGMYESGGTLMALWIGFCSLCGIALSVAAPLFLARRLRAPRACITFGAPGQLESRRRRPLTPGHSRSL